MEFDHRDATQKSGFVSRMAGNVTIRRLLEEIAKCDIVARTAIATAASCGGPRTRE
jgi:hypothetical protein